MPLSLVTEPAEAILTAAEAKAHMRVETEDDDTLIAAYIAAFEKHIDGVDGILNRALVTQTWDLWLDQFPASDQIPLHLPLPPVQEITHVKYYNTANELTTWEASKYFLDEVSEPARLFPTYSECWPIALDRPNAVNVRFVAGYGDAADVPAPILHAAKMAIANWYENRESLLVGSIVAEMPMAVKWLLQKYKVYSV